MRPLPVQEGGVPMLFACHLRAGREAQFRRAARLGDGFISISEPPSEFAEVGRRVAEYASAYGRDPAGMERVFYMTVNLNSEAAEAETGGGPVDPHVLRREHLAGFVGAVGIGGEPRQRRYGSMKQAGAYDGDCAVRVVQSDGAV